jgi:hypothetical protein
MWYILCHISYDISMVPYLWCHMCLYCFQNIVSHGLYPVPSLVWYISAATPPVPYVSVALIIYCLICAIPCATFSVICILCHIYGTIYECTLFKLLHFFNADVVVQISCTACNIFFFNDAVVVQIYCSASKLLFYLFNDVVVIHIYCTASTIVRVQRFWTTYLSFQIPQYDCTTCSMMLQWFTYIVLLLRYYSCSTWFVVGQCDCNTHEYLGLVDNWSSWIPHPHEYVCIMNTFT